MSRLAWGTSGERYFETGVDRGVLFIGEEPGVPWNGLTAVQEEPTGGEPRPFYLDGYKYLNVSTAEEFAATINAFSAPSEFAVCDGRLGLGNGLFVTQQPRKPFGFSYRTLVGNDIQGTDHAYKIHLVYNALAAPATKENTSVTNSVTPQTMSWKISTTPPLLTGIRPTAHMIIDSRYTPSGLMREIENILYGTEEVDSRLPPMAELQELFASIGPLIATNTVIDPSFESATLLTFPIKYNRLHTPRPEVGSGWATGGTGGSYPTLTENVVRTGPFEEDAYVSRIYWTAPQSGVAVSINSGNVTGRKTSVIAGNFVTASMFIKSNNAHRGRLRLRFRNFDNTVVADVQSSTYESVPADEWVRMQYSAIVPDDSLYLEISYLTSTSSSWDTDDELMGTLGMVNDGPTLIPYFDGDFAESLPEDRTVEWLNPASRNAIPSIMQADMDLTAGFFVGRSWSASGEKSVYLPEISEISPGFMGYTDTPGVIDLGPIDPYVNRWVLVAYEAIDQSDNYRGVATLGGISANEGRIMFGTTGPGIASMYTRVDTLNGDVNKTITLSGARTPGLHTGFASGYNLMRAISFGIDQNVTVSPITMAPGDGIPQNLLRLYEPTPGIIPKAAAAFYGNLDVYGYLAAHYWLKNRFNHAVLNDQTFMITPRSNGQFVYFNNKKYETAAGVPIRIYGTGTIGLGPGYWDDKLIVDGYYPGPYFDGDTPDLNGRYHKWVGTPHQSESTLETWYF